MKYSLTHLINLSILTQFIVLLVPCVTRNVCYGSSNIILRLPCWSLLGDCGYQLVPTQADGILPQTRCCISLYVESKIVNGNCNVIYGLNMCVPLAHFCPIGWLQRRSYSTRFFCTCPLHVSHLGHWVCRHVSVGCVQLSHVRCCDTNTHLHADILFAQISEQHARSFQYRRININLEACGCKMKLLNMPDSLVYSNQFYLSCCLNNILLMETLFFS